MLLESLSFKKCKQKKKTLMSVQHRAEKKYIDALISSVVNETTKNYDFEEFRMTVIQMDKMNTTDLGFVQISAPKVKLISL